MKGFESFGTVSALGNVLEALSMPRGLSSAQITAISQRVAAIAYFVELDVSTPVYVWSGYGPISALGQTWQGVGETGIISGVQSDQTLKSQSISVSLVGLPADLVPGGVIAATRAVRYQGKSLTVYFGVLDTVTGALIDNPVAVWTGFADVLSFQRGSSVTVTLTGEHLSSRTRLANGLRMTTASHNNRLGLTGSSSLDLFFEPQTGIMGLAQPLIN